MALRKASPTGKGLKLRAKATPTTPAPTPQVRKASRSLRTTGLGGSAHRRFWKLPMPRSS